jgi:uncharacterized protein
VVKPSAKDRSAFLRTLQSARLGTPEAQYELGLMLANGIGVPQNIEQAVVWISESAKRGFVAAQYLLATRYATGVGIDKDEHRAIVWYLKAAEQGHAKAYFRLGKLHAAARPQAAHSCYLRAAEMGLAEAQLALGHAYAKGLGLPKDDEQALHWYALAADQGMAAAQCALAAQYVNGHGVEPDIDIAFKWYRQAALQNYAPAQVAMEILEAQGKAPLGGRQRKAKKKEVAERRQQSQRWTEAAQSGDAEVFYHLGLMHEQGLALPQDIEAATEWYQRAARLGDVRSQLALGRLLQLDQPETALDWISLAAAQGDAQAQRELGHWHSQDSHSTGSSPQNNLLAGVFSYSKAAEQQDAPSLLALGEMLSAGAPQAAWAAFRQAAELGLAPAQFILGQKYASGEMVVKNLTLALGWYKRAAVQGYAPAQCAVGTFFLDGIEVPKDLVVALRWFSQAAEQGDAKAQWNLGAIFASGGEGVKRDIKLAFQWCHESAALGFTPALATLGLLFARIKNHEQAVACWKKAAEQGDPEAQYNLGLMYSKGQGTEKDLAQAFNWFTQAAQQGVPSAQGRLGLMYATGDTVARDLIEAHKWLILAAKGNDKTAKANFVRSEAALGLMQITEAERRAHVWRPVLMPF